MNNIKRPEHVAAADVDLTGVDGNALSVVGVVARGLRAAGNRPEDINTFRREAMAGDYDHLLAVVVAYTTTSDAA